MSVRPVISAGVRPPFELAVFKLGLAGVENRAARGDGGMAEAWVKKSFSVSGSNKNVAGIRDVLPALFAAIQSVMVVVEAAQLKNLILFNRNGGGGVQVLKEPGRSADCIGLDNSWLHDIRQDNARLAGSHGCSGLRRADIRRNPGKPGLGRNEFIGFGSLFYLLRVVKGYFSG